MPAGMALELVANQQFNSAPHLTSLMVRASRIWRVHGARLAPARGIPTPMELYGAATGVAWEDFAALVAIIHSQVVEHGRVWFTRELFDALDLSPDQVARILNQISTSQAALTELVLEETLKWGLDWSFNIFRQYPLITLDDDSLLLISPRFLVERLSDIPFYWDIVNHLRSQSDKKTEGRFDRLHADALEAYAIEVAMSVAPPISSNKRVYSESDLKRAWGSKKQTPRICDLIIDYGDVWVCIEVIGSRLTESTLNATDPADLDAELAKFLTERKAHQLASTIHLLKTNEVAVTGRAAPEHRRFIPVLLAAYGFPVNDATMTEVARHLKALNLLQPPIYALRIISMRDLEILEAATEAGHDGAALLRRWAEGADVAAPLDNFLDDIGIGLRPPARLGVGYKELADEFIGRLKREDPT
jgi:hypothetical protein